MVFLLIPSWEPKPFRLPPLQVSLYLSFLTRVFVVISGPAIIPPCNYSYWSSWTQCTAQLCGQGTQTRTRTYINTGDCGPKDTNPETGCPLIETRICKAYTDYPCTTTPPVFLVPDPLDLPSMC